MEISREEIKKLANLSMLTCDESDYEWLEKDMGQILGFVKKLAEADISDIDSENETIDFDTLRSDDVKKSMPREDVLCNAPNHNGETIIVPRVVE